MNPAVKDDLMEVVRECERGDFNRVSRIVRVRKRGVDLQLAIIAEALGVPTDVAQKKARVYARRWEKIQRDEGGTSVEAEAFRLGHPESIKRRLPTAD